MSGWLPQHGCTAEQRIAQLERTLAAAQDALAEVIAENTTNYERANRAEALERAALEQARIAERENERMRPVIECAEQARDAAKNYAPDQESAGFQNYIKALAETWFAVDAMRAAREEKP